VGRLLICVQNAGDAAVVPPRRCLARLAARHLLFTSTLPVFCAHRRLADDALANCAVGRAGRMAGTVGICGTPRVLLRFRGGCSREHAADVWLQRAFAFRLDAVISGVVCLACSMDWDNPDAFYPSLLQRLACSPRQLSSAICLSSTM